MNDQLKQDTGFAIDNIQEPENLEDVIFTLMVNPNLSTINYFNDFSDQLISSEALEDTGSEEGGIFTLDDLGLCMAMTTHATHHHLFDDPEKATLILITRAVRKMLCYGAKPVALSAFLYHIDYADPNGHFVASEVKNGIEKAAKCFNLKITDKKVRFDNYLNQGAVPATLIISMMGYIENKGKIIMPVFKNKGNNIFVIGKSKNDINSSQYLEFYHNVPDSPLPWFDIETGVSLQKILSILNKKQLISSASPVGRGGLFFTLLRAAFPNNLGFDITTDAEIRRDAFLFGESMGRIIVDVDPEKEDEFVDTLTENKMPFFTLGHVTRGEIRIDDQSFGFIDKISSI